MKQTGKRVSFQLWIEDGTDNIWFAYPAGFGAAIGAVSPTATIGAENLAGTEAVHVLLLQRQRREDGQAARRDEGCLGGPRGDDGDARLQGECDRRAEQQHHQRGAGDGVVHDEHGLGEHPHLRRGHRYAAAISIQSTVFAMSSWTASMYDSYELWRSTSPYVAPGAGDSIKVYGGRGVELRRPTRTDRRQPRRQLLLRSAHAQLLGHVKRRLDRRCRVRLRAGSGAVIRRQKSGPRAASGRHFCGRA